MKTIVFFFLLLAMIARGENGWETIPPIPSTVRTWMSAEEMPSSRRIGLLSPPPVVTLPESFAIQSREAARDWIVGTNGLEAAVWVKVQVPTTVGFSQMSVGKRFVGYQSYSTFLSDLHSGFEIVLWKAKAVTNYTGGPVGFGLTITYFNDTAGVPLMFGLSMTRLTLGSLQDSITVPMIISSFASYEVNDNEKVVVRAPQLSRFQVDGLDQDGKSFQMLWTKVSGVQLSSWPRPQPETVANFYVSLSSWLGGTNQSWVRIQLDAESGESQTYTQFGERLSSPTVIGMDHSRILTIISAPRGADIEIWSSSTVTPPEWRYRAVVERVFPPISVQTLGSDGTVQFYRAIAK